MNFKEIHIGSMIKKIVTEKQIEALRIRNFLKLNQEEIEKMYTVKSLDTHTLLRWSKLLEYDFFRVYTQHLILYAPSAKTDPNNKTNSLPQFRKNIYTEEVIDFIIELVTTGKKTKQQAIEEYNIPKATLYRWIKKYVV